MTGPSQTDGGRTPLDALPWTLDGLELRTRVGRSLFALWAAITCLGVAYSLTVPTDSLAVLYVQVGFLLAGVTLVVLAVFSLLSGGDLVDPPV